MILELEGGCKNLSEMLTLKDEFLTNKTYVPGAREFVRYGYFS